MRYSNEFLLEKYKTLPKSVRDILITLNMDALIKAITEKHRIHLDIADVLDDEITYVIFGAEKSTDFIRNLKAQLKLPDEKINAIAKDVNEKIFLPIREALKKAVDASSSESANDFSTVQEGIKNKELGEETEELDEIKKQIAKQKITKPAVVPPPNLPTGAPAGASPESSEPKEPHLVTRLPSEEKKPAHIDPYREPIE